MFASTHILVVALLEVVVVRVSSVSGTEASAATLTVWAPASSWESKLPTDGFGVSLHTEVISALGTVKDVVQKRLPDFAKTLEPMFACTPKNEHDNLGHAAVRYTLNRFFVQRHGWFVNGLFAGQGGSRWNESSVTGLLVQYIPLQARHAFERRLSGKGLDLNGTALLAATIEAVILEGAVHDARQCYELMRLPTEGSISAARVDDVIAMLIAMKVSDTTPEQWRNKTEEGVVMDSLKALASEVYPRWQSALIFLRQIREQVASGRHMFDFLSVADVVVEVEGQWARWSANIECQQLKGKLLDIEDGHHTGCVRLAQFYARSMDPKDGWQFKENAGYLRQLGALDESDPENPRVIVPNYINSLGNCVSAGKYYQACCISECESLQVQIERIVQMPTARPEAITDAVRGLASATVPANSVLSRSLVRHIHEIARIHGGRVPLQSRLFAQWLHFAYPSECSFPHLAGSTKPVGVNLYGDSQLVSDEVAWQVIHAGMQTSRSKTSNGTCTRWRDEEELFVPTFRPSRSTLAELERDPSLWISICAVTALSAAVLMLIRTARGIYKPKRALSSKPAYLV
eukprot:TRINITY_DN1961_c0_g1_i1.p1 TRINITY_DN1961_c0_g1~~TRINITY_DN1961_c0_g1_i1.p1  ORF type:complete len:575 (-),score=59.19 TRINITY_DN1961_c0_g1_i1:51-1775(-)